MLPFRNTLVTLTMSGAELSATLEDAMQSAVAGNTGAYPYAGALHWQVDLGRAGGARLSALEHRNAGGQCVALDPAARYRVITNDFVAARQDGYTTRGTLGADRRCETFLADADADADADAVLQYMKDKSALSRPETANFSTQRFIDTP